VAQKKYPLRSGINLIKNVKHTPCTDGGGIKLTFESKVFQLAQSQIKQPISPRKAMMPLAADRYGMAESLHNAGFEIVFCDLMFGLGIPIPVKGLKQLRFLAGIIVPVAGLLPISIFYPTGQDQDKITPKYEKWYNYGPVIAGDFQYIRQHLPQDLGGKIIITNTTTTEDVDLLQSRGVSYLITTTPRIDGRSFGTNVLEAALIAYAGKGRLLTQNELSDLLQQFEVKPTVQELNPV